MGIVNSTSNVASTQNEIAKSNISNHKQDSASQNKSRFEHLYEGLPVKRLNFESEMTLADTTNKQAELFTSQAIQK